VPVWAPTAALRDLTLGFLNNLQSTIYKSNVELIVVESETCVVTEADIYIATPNVDGFGHAVNLGIKLASHEWIAVIGNDITLQEGWLPKLQSVFNSIPGCGFLHPADQTDGEPPLEGECWWPMVLTKRSVLDNVGLLDEQLSWRYHDQDISIRAAMKGYRVIRTSEVRVQHLNGATWNSMQEDKRKKHSDEEGEIILKRYGCSMYHQWYVQHIKRLV